MTLLLFLLLQLPTEPADKSPQRTKHERTVFYAQDGKTVCGTISQYDTGRWHVFLTQKDITVPRFETRKEAVTWVKAYCPVQGQVGHKQ